MNKKEQITAAQAQFTLAELDAIKNNFEAADKNRDNLLDYEEFKSVISTPKKEVGDKEAKHLFGIFDINGDRKISFSEFLTTLSIITNGSQRDKLEFLFDFYDTNDDDLLSKKEIEVLINHLQEVVSTYLLADEQKARLQAEALVKQIDTNEDGKITRKEWIEFGLKSPELLQIFGLM